MGAPLRSDETSSSVASLLTDIVKDIQKLINQEVALARTQLQEEWVKGKSAMAWMSVTMVCLAVAAILGAFGLVYLLHGPVGVPLWLSFLLVALILGGTGYYLLQRGRQALSRVNLLPPVSVNTFKENVKWIGNQT